MRNEFGLDAKEWRTLRALKRPGDVQRFLDEEIAYNIEPDGPTCLSPRQALRQTRAHCMEGAMLAALALRVQGHPPLLLDLESVRDDDHVLAVFQVDGCWGAVAKSNYSGLRYREPVYRSLRELVMSYFAHYYNLQGEHTLRAYSTRPLDLSRFDRQGWMTSEVDIWYVPEYLCGVGHTKVLKAGQERRLGRMDKRLFEAGLVGRVEH
ncbi:MAG: hypothetical protein HY858_05550 [Candidatus Solibacter usitatus]|nr:hypothetical protein [Candidatus Solibacter usitatus]